MPNGGVMAVPPTFPAFGRRNAMGYRAERKLCSVTQAVRRNAHRQRTRASAPRLCSVARALLNVETSDRAHTKRVANQSNWR